MFFFLETKPGSNPKDADFVVNKVVKDIVNSKKYAPCNEGFHWVNISYN